MICCTRDDHHIHKYLAGIAQSLALCLKTNQKETMHISITCGSEPQLIASCFLLFILALACWPPVYPEKTLMQRERSMLWCDLNMIPAKFCGVTTVVFVCAIYCCRNRNMHMHHNLHDVVFRNVPRSLMTRNSRERICSFIIPACCRISLPYITGFDIKIIHQRIQTTCLSDYHHYCSIDIVLFHNVTCYINNLLSHILVNSTDLLNITCTLIAPGLIWGRLECINNQHLVGSIQHAVSCICWWESAMRLRWDERRGSAEVVWDLEKAKILEGYYE